MINIKKEDYFTVNANTVTIFLAFVFVVFVLALDCLSLTLRLRKVTHSFRARSLVLENIYKYKCENNNTNKYKDD